MFRHIMAPVDLSHLETLARALEVAGDEARHHGCPLTYVSVTGNTPGPVAHNPHEFEEKLKAFAATQAALYGIDARAHVIVSHDPTVDTDRKLMAAADEIGADLVIMASHPPGVGEYFWPSHGGHMASHARTSVMLVRDS